MYGLRLPVFKTHRKEMYSVNERAGFPVTRQKKRAAEAARSALLGAGLHYFASTMV
jgi:hypothetical protein